MLSDFGLAEVRMDPDSVKCMCVFLFCLSVVGHISKRCGPIFTKFGTQVVKLNKCII